MTTEDVTTWGPRAGATGPVHLVVAGAWANQAWCGSRAQFRHTVGPGTLDDVTCPKCLAAIKRGRPAARRSGKR